MPPRATAACRDTPGWHNKFGAGCFEFVSDGHCGGGALLPGHEWAGDAEFGSPGANCCACGKAADGWYKPTVAEAEQDEPAAAARTADDSYADEDEDEDDAIGDDGGCEDSAGWSNKFGATCRSYDDEGHCSDGGFMPGHEWSGGAAFGSPELHCCVCGKAPPERASSPSPPPEKSKYTARGGCRDTAGWTN
eukprot:6915771-Prymnesium_polylepis.1